MSVGGSPCGPLGGLLSFVAMVDTAPTQPPLQRHAARAFLVLLCLLAPLVPRAQELPPHSQHHPRLFFSADEAGPLLAAIQADPARLEVWDEARNLAATYVLWSPDMLLSSYFGYRIIEELSLMSSLEEAPEDSLYARAVVDALIWQVDEYDTEPDPFLSVLGVALRLHNLAWGWDLACHAATPAERQAIADEMLRYMADLSTDWEFVRFQHNPYVSNKGITLGAMLRLAALALERDLPVAPEIALAHEAADRYLAKGVDDLLTPGGVYREGLGYFAWAMRTLMPTWRAVDRLEGSPPWSDAQLQATLEAMAYQMMDEGGGLYLNRNDHNSTDFIVGRHHSILEFATRFGPDPDLARWLLRRSSGDLGHPLGHLNDPVATMLWHEAGGESGPEPLPAGRLFPEAGLWVYRTSWPGDPVADRFLLTLEAGEFKGGHAQEDVGQLILRALGHGFALDHGAGVDAKETAAHNLPLVNGRGQHNAGSSIGTDGTLRRFIAGPRWEALRADMTTAYTTHSPYNDPDWPIAGTDWSWGYDGGNPMYRAWRELLLLPGGDNELPEIWLRDRLAGEPSLEPGIAWRVHMDTDLVIDDVGEGLWRAAGSGGLLHMRLHGPDPAGASASQSLFTVENDDPDSRVLSLHLPESDADFLWQWTPLRPGEPAPVVATERFDAGIRVSSVHGGRERRLLVAHDATPLAADGDTLIGAWGLVEREGAATRTLLLEGSRFVEQERLLVALDGVGSAGCEGDTVRLSDPELGFRVWAPGAAAVVAQGESVGFDREGDYVIGPSTSPPEPPERVALLAPWPNPGDPPLSFAVEMPRAGRAELSLYDLRGRRLRRIVKSLPAGTPTMIWDGRDASGRAMPAGVYLARVEALGRVDTRKFVLLEP